MIGHVENAVRITDDDQMSQREAGHPVHLSGSCEIDLDLGGSLHVGQPKEPDPKLLGLRRNLTKLGGHLARLGASEALRELLEYLGTLFRVAWQPPSSANDTTNTFRASRWKAREPGLQRECGSIAKPATAK